MFEGFINSIVFAQALENPIKYNSLDGLIIGIIDGILIILIPILTLGIMYIGVQFVLAQGAPDKIRNLKTGLIYLLLGLFLVLGAKGILYVIQETVEDIRGDITYQIEESALLI